jgi:hypothetical protein
MTPGSDARALRDRTAGLVALSFDVEWASKDVLADLLALLGERRLRGTFFCTHAGIEVPGHERGLHPNFRRQGDTMKGLEGALGKGGLAAAAEEAVYRHVVATTKAYCPEAIGVRAHSLFYDSQLVRIYKDAGLMYDSSYAMPFVEGLRPVRKEYEMLELPIYYQDHLDLKTGTTGFDVGAIDLGSSGMKVFNFHPNMLFINAVSDEHYLACKPVYHDRDRLLAMRHPGKGIRTLFLELLDRLAARAESVVTLAEIRERCVRS